MGSPGMHRFDSGSNSTNEAAIVFVHGFTGDWKATWNNIPRFLRDEAALSDWDLWGFGYQTRRSFDILGIWQADAKLEEIATELYSSPPLRKYKTLTLVAHSMGGLVVQRALVRFEDLRSSTSHVVFFGTPSKGLVKATLASFLKQQVNNMSASGEFIRQLRSDWDRLGLSSGSPFTLISVAGETDQFVPPDSSLYAFPASIQRVIPGNHLTMLRADSSDTPCVQIIVDAITKGSVAGGPRNAARLAIEKGKFQQVIDRFWPKRSELDDAGAVTLALALDEVGRREDSIAFLESHQPEGTDVLGVLAGRYKRRWLLERLRKDVVRAFELYQQGYDKAAAKPNHDQAYYHGINLAFLELAYGADIQAARARAKTVLMHCEKASDPGSELWRLASEGDALIILGQDEEALQKHRAAAQREISPWQALSIQEQSIRVADLCGWSGARLKTLSALYEKRIG